MAPVESVGHSEQAAQPADHRLIGRGERRELGVLAPGAALPVVAADERHQLALPGRQPQPLGVGDELVAVLVVLPVAHQLSHVVQQSRRLQEQPLLRRAAELLAQLVEELERQLPHVLHVAPVRLAALGELAEEPERVAEHRLLGPGHLEQQPFAQPECAHREAPAPDPVEQLRRHREAGENDVGPRGVEAGDLPPLLGVRLASQSMSCSTSAAVTSTPCTGSAGESPRRAWTIRPSVVKVPPLPITVAPAHSRQGSSRLSCFRMNGRSRGDFLVGRPVAGQVELGEAHGAERERQGELDQAVHRADQLQAAAADVRHQGALAGQGEVMRHRAVGEGGFGLRVDDPERDVQLLADPADEPGPVLRFAHGGGRHRGDPVHAAALADVAHPAQALHGPVHGGVVEAAGGGQAAGEPGLVLELVHDSETARGIVLRHQQTDGVGSDVDGRDPLATGRGRGGLSR